MKAMKHLAVRLAMAVGVAQAATLIDGFNAMTRYVSADGGSDTLYDGRSLVPTAEPSAVINSGRADGQAITVPHLV